MNQFPIFKFGVLRTQLQACAKRQFSAIPAKVSESAESNAYRSNFRADRKNPFVAHFLGLLRQNGSIERSHLYEYIVEDKNAKKLSVTDLEELLTFLAFEVMFSNKTAMMPALQYVWSVADENKMKATEKMYICMFEGCAKSRNLAIAQRILKQMQESKIKPNYAVFGAIVQLYTGVGGYEKANDILEKCRNKLPDNELAYVYARYVHSLGSRFASTSDLSASERQVIVKLVFDVLKLLETKNEEFWQKNLVMSLIGALSTCGKSENAVALLRSAEKAHGFTVNDAIYYRLMRPFSQKRAYGEVVLFYKEMLDKNIPIKKNSIWSMLMLAFANLNDKESFWYATKKALGSGGCIIYRDGKQALAVYYLPGEKFTLKSFLEECKANGIEQPDKIKPLLTALRDGFAVTKDFEGVKNANAAIQMYNAL